jgi:YbbR domain-containing protein
MKVRIKNIVFDNFSYKVVSLFIALILWLTILGRRDFVLTKVLDVEIMPRQDRIVLSQSADTVKVKVSGPRTALKKFIESGLSQLVSIDTAGREGSFDVDVPLQKIDVPFGVKVLSVKPSKIQVQVAPRLPEK